ncbi:MAG: InlB B-repeat-containing protein, partial [Spirochaetales bacterium]|nr:InlB B-repeat-containing protein [Spirochaetales bacterium]
NADNNAGTGSNTDNNAGTGSNTGTNSKKIFTITFDVNGGTGTAPEKIEATAEDIIELPTIKDENFSHWNTKADGNGDSYQESGKFTEDTTLYAIYLKVGEYKIIYHLDGGVNNPKNPYIYKEGDSIYLKEPTREGYYFVGWKGKAGNVLKRPLVDKNNLEFTTVWAERRYNVIYHSNCEQADVKQPFAPEEETIYIKHSVFEREGYTFTGWYKDEGCTKLFSNINTDIQYTVTSAAKDIDLYAGWTKPVYIHNLRITVTSLPDKVKALSIWGNINDWNYDNISANKDLYITEVIDGTAEFSFIEINILNELQFQFVPMTSEDMPMSDDTRKATAFSGSSEFSDKNSNLIYNFFANDNVLNNMELILDVAEMYGKDNVEKYVFERRLYTDRYNDAFRENVVDTDEYKIIYHSEEEDYDNPNRTTFYTESIVRLKDAVKSGYMFLGWYDNEKYSGEPITGWNAGEKTADVDLWAKWEKRPEGWELLCTGEGIYSYTVSIDNVATHWGNSSKTSPDFSIFLLKDDHVKAGDIYAANPLEPAYQISNYGDMRIKDVSKTGSFAIFYYGDIVNGYYPCYSGVAATVTATTITVFVDMSKLVKTDLKAFFVQNSKPTETSILEGDDVDLTGYKPYIVALADDDEENYQFDLWSSTVMKMTPGATFPADELTKTAPDTCYDLRFIRGSITNGETVELRDNAFDFTFDLTKPYFIFKSVYNLAAGGVNISELDTEFKLVEEENIRWWLENITFADDVLTADKTYTVTLIVKGEHEAYVKVSEKVPED